MFEVSRLSITTAINRLAFEGLVVVEPQRGSYVARIHLEDVKQWMLMRRVLEMEVVAVCASHRPAQAVENLGQNLAYQQAAIQAAICRVFTNSTPASIASSATGGFRRLGEVLDQIRTHLDRVRRTLLPEPGRPQGTFRTRGDFPRDCCARAGSGKKTKWQAISIAYRASCRLLSRNIPAFL